MSLKTKRLLSRLGYHLMMLVLVLLMIFPFLWMLSASFKQDIDILTTAIRWIPNPATLENYRRALTEVAFLTYLGNTVVVAVCGTALQVICCALSGYAFAKLRFCGKSLMFTAFIATMMMPWHSIMIPQYVMMSRLRLTDSLLVLILMQAFSAFGIFLLRQFFMQLPDSLREAAKIDGAGELRIFWQIMLPHATPALSALVIFTFIGQWNDYISPLVYLNSQRLYTLQLGLKSFEGQYTTQYGVVMAGTVCCLIPIFMIYLVFEKQICAGIVFTGMKN